MAGETTAEFVPIYQCALSLLARREHSVHELSGKLRKRFPLAPSVIASVINRLREEEFQSDRRFAECLLASRQQRGVGPARIRNELQAKGVERVLIAELLTGIDNSDISSLHMAWRKKFSRKPNTPLEKRKQTQFLLYRGFSMEQIGHFYQTITEKEND